MSGSAAWGRHQRRMFARWLGVMLAGVWLIGGWGCVSGPGGGREPGAERAPFAYEPLRVRNSCFVESVHFYDEYLRMRRGGESSWARVLQWGTREGDFKIGEGHAVIVFTQGGAVWSYDINHGFAKLSVEEARRNDLTDVAPAVQATYTQFKPVFSRYQEDYAHAAPTDVPEYLFYHASQDVREASKVGSELGRYRQTRVVEFTFAEEGKPALGAAVVFVFGQKLCVYLPRKGTHVFAGQFTRPDDLRVVAELVRRFFPSVTEVRWQKGGYWFYPPKQT